MNGFNSTQHALDGKLDRIVYIKWSGIVMLSINCQLVSRIQDSGYTCEGLSRLRLASEMSVKDCFD